MQLKEAQLLYKDGDYEMLSLGNYVVCAVTKAKIFIDDLTYWSVARQEPYINCAAALKRELELSKLS